MGYRPKQILLPGPHWTWPHWGALHCYAGSRDIRVNHYVMLGGKLFRGGSVGPAEWAEQSRLVRHRAGEPGRRDTPCSGLCHGSRQWLQSEFQAAERTLTRSKDPRKDPGEEV